MITNPNCTGVYTEKMVPRPCAHCTKQAVARINDVDYCREHALYGSIEGVLLTHRTLTVNDRGYLEQLSGGAVQR